MKKIFLITLLLIFLHSHAQKISFQSDMQVYYELTFKPDPTNIKLVTNSVNLYLGENKSIFQDGNRYKIDSIIQSQKLTALPSLPMFSTNHVIYKDLNKSEITYSETIDNINFGYNEPIKSLKWKLLNGKKTILNLQCNEASIDFHGRTYTAWYTSDIPISDGPYKFSGLPGLILEVYDNEENFHYKPLAITKKKMTIIYDSSFNVIERKKLRDTKINNIIKHKPDIKLNPMEKD